MVASPQANLVMGNKVVARLVKGQRVVVIEVRDSWVGTYVAVNGQKVPGWISISDFVPAGGAAKAEPQIYAASEAVGVVPAQEAPSVQARRPVASRPGDDYFRNYNYRYYSLHETDPNIHAWEPWTH